MGLKKVVMRRFEKLVRATSQQLETLRERDRRILELEQELAAARGAAGTGGGPGQAGGDGTTAAAHIPQACVEQIRRERDRWEEAAKQGLREQARLEGKMEEASRVLVDALEFVRGTHDEKVREAVRILDRTRAAEEADPMAPEAQAKGMKVRIRMLGARIEGAAGTLRGMDGLVLPQAVREQIDEAIRQLAEP